MNLRQLIPLAMKRFRQSLLRGKGGGSYGVRLLVLMSFMASSIGIPVGDWSFLAQSDGAAATPWCRCSQSARQSKTCCCAKRVAAVSPGGCCSTKGRPNSSADASRPSVKAGGCCSRKKPVPQEVATKSAAIPDEKGVAWVSPCGCGPTDFPMLLVNQEPRILTESVTLDDLPSRGGSFPAGDVLPSGQRSRPLVPPPKSPLVG